LAKTSGTIFFRNRIELIPEEAKRHTPVNVDKIQYSESLTSSEYNQKAYNFTFKGNFVASDYNFIFDRSIIEFPQN
jgi:hypothetical protein